MPGIGGDEIIVKNVAVAAQYHFYNECLRYEVTAANMPHMLPFELKMAVKRAPIIRIKRGVSSRRKNDRSQLKLLSYQKLCEAVAINMKLCNNMHQLQACQ